MPRPKSAEKRCAIMIAACDVFAERGLAAATTAEIARRAAVAEGTLFTYFRTREVLLNELREQIGQELESALCAEFPERKKLRSRFKFMWNQYIRWAGANPHQHAVTGNFKDALTFSDAVQTSGTRPFARLESLAIEAEKKGALRNYLAPEFVCRTFIILAGEVLDRSLKDPENASKVSAAGFKMFWKGALSPRKHRSR